MNKAKKSTVTTICIMIIISIAIIAFYYFISTRTSPLFTKPVTASTELEKLLQKDIKSNYPSSPREVIKLYNRLTKELYSGNLKEDQINKLADQMICLYDDELIANNSYNSYLVDLKVDVTDYKKAKRVIIQYEVESSESVQYWEKEDKKYASIISNYAIKEGTDLSKTYEKFVLRKDTEGKWKILGWELSDEK